MTKTMNAKKNDILLNVINQYHRHHLMHWHVTQSRSTFD